ncbi:MAG: ABC transporter substrate-binding protein [Candidatus Hodarchaeota archaeon]
MGVESKNESTKKKKPKKKRIFAEHKPLVVGSIIGVVAIAGIVGGIVLFLGEEQYGGTLTKAYCGLWCNDTLWSWEDWSVGGWNGMGSSVDIIDQIAEGLFEYEITDDYSAIVPNLATGFEWSDDYLNFTCPLRKGVKFHDGTPFNATAVKRTFERLHNLIDNITYFYSPYVWYDDGELIINRTEVIDDYTVRFVLNKPFPRFMSLLVRRDTYILSPRAAPLNAFIDTDTALIGTGPFKYDSSTFLYDPPSETYYTANTTLLANLDYWNGRPKLDKLVFKNYEELVIFDNWNPQKFEDLVSGKIQLANIFPFTIHNENYTQYPGITLHPFDSLYIQFITINNNLINTTMRKTLSYAINYSKILNWENIRYEGGVIRCRSPVSKGLPYSNWEDFDVPDYNLTYARQVLKDVNWNGTAGALTANDNITAGNEWESLVTNGTPLAIYNYTYKVTSAPQFYYRYILVENFKQIGVEVNLIPIVQGEEWKYAWSHFRYAGWGPDYFDPCSNINTLFSSKADGDGNLGNVNDSLVQQWMEMAFLETNETARAKYYYDIQKRLIEVVYPCLWTYTERYCIVQGFYHVTSKTLKGINYNLVPLKLSLKDAHF